MKRRFVLGCWTIVGLTLAALSIIAFLRTRPIDVAIKPLPPQPADNSFYAISRLAQRTQTAAEDSRVLRLGRSDLPDERDEDLRRNFMKEMESFREQYVPLIGKPFMPPKRFPHYELPYLGEGVIYWSVAEAVLIDDLLRSSRYDEAAAQLSSTLRFANQLMQYAEVGSMLSASFMQSRSLYVLERYFANIPSNKAIVFSDSLLQCYDSMPPLSEIIDAEEAAAILELKHEQSESKDLLWNAMYDYRGLARAIRSEFDHFRKQQPLPIAKREEAPEPKTFVRLYTGSPIFWDVYDRRRVQLQLLSVAFAIRHYQHENGTYPRELEDLEMGDHITDPFTGEQLIYRTSPDGFLLYARGYDGDDDGGERAIGSKGPGDVGVLSPRREEINAQSRKAKPLWLK